MNFERGTGGFRVALLAALGLPSFAACGGDERFRGGVDTDGPRHRAATTECTSSLPRSTSLPPSGGPDPCASDSDCTEREHGMCEEIFTSSLHYCEYGCVTDSDCPDSTVCYCGDPVGRCVPTNCEDDADCGDLSCAYYPSFPGCDFDAFACQTDEDECRSDADCASGQSCTFTEERGRRFCEARSCVIGRPFLVQGNERLANAARRGDWLTELEPSLYELSPRARAELARAWTRIALMEHASIAAFARFSLELLAFGAPASLLESAARAMSDETDHARKAFALASAYAGGPRGPGPLAIDGALTAPDLDASVLTAFLEGCIGETVAALEAREAAELASDAAVRAILTQIAEDESNHALLAYQFLKWALPRAGASLVTALHRALAAELDRVEVALARPASPVSAVAAELRAHGIVGEARRDELRRSVLLEVVAPCLAELSEPSEASSKAALCA